MTDFTKEHLTAIRTELGKISALGNHATVESYFINTSLCKKGTCRHLTPEEVPALALLIRRFERQADGGIENERDYAQTAPDDIKELL